MKKYIDISSQEAEVTFYSRNPKEEYYVKIQRNSIDLDSAILSLGYSNKESYLKNINQKEEEEY